MKVVDARCMAVERLPIARETAAGVEGDQQLLDAREWMMANAQPVRMPFRAKDRSRRCERRSAYAFSDSR
jgi:hypothetical protein